MTDKSNNQGRAFEYICLITLYQEINKVRRAVIVKNSCFNANKKAWESTDNQLQTYLTTGAIVATNKIFELEPLILEKDEHELCLTLQKDSCGQEGDVRDIVISRQNIKWEIGISLKHNHFAVKHSRLSKQLDFGKEWYGIACSQKYWYNILPIFEYLDNERKKGTKWKELGTNKATKVYIPLLKAFMAEIANTASKDYKFPEKLVKYLLGKFDFYKIINIDRMKMTRIQGYNFNGTLNKPSKNQKPKITIPLLKYPTRLVAIDFKIDEKNNKKSDTTIEMYFNEGWQFSFRLHNASKTVETSLKFDVQIIGLPTNLIKTIDCLW